MKLSLENVALFFCMVLGMVFPTTVWAKKGSLLDTKPFYLYVGGTFGMARPVSDEVAGASYTRNMHLPITGAAGLGWNVFSGLSISVRYEKWWARNSFNQSGNTETNDLELQLVGGEVAYVRGNGRVAYHFSLGGMYPVDQKIVSTVNGTSNGIYTRGTPFWNYHARASMMLKLGALLGLQLEGGYRWINLKNLDKNGVPFISGGSDLNLSGPFIGLGFVRFF